MRRLACRLFTLCSAVSLLLCVAVCALWARSATRSDTLHAHVGSQTDLTANSRAGILTLLSHRTLPTVRSTLAVESKRLPDDEGFDWRVFALKESPFGDLPMLWISLPHWVPVLLTGCRRSGASTGGPGGGVPPRAGSAPRAATTSAPPAPAAPNAAR